MDELCNVQDCLGETKYYPVLLVASHTSDEPAEIRLAYPVCEMHAKYLKLDDILPGNQWDFLVNTAFTQNGLKIPLKALTVIKWREWGDGREGTRPDYLPGSVQPADAGAVEPDGPGGEGEPDEGAFELWDEDES